MVRKEIRDKKYAFSFIMYSPENQTKKLPLIVQLHGAGERGDGNAELAAADQYGFSKLFAENEYECILAEPQCAKDSFWVAEISKIIEFIQQIEQDYPIDEKRIYLTGVSMGGFGTWYTAMARPDMFAAIAPCCGGGMPWNAAVLDMPVWAFHGDEDDVVKLSNTTDMIEAMQKAGYNPKMTIYKRVGHNSWDYAYDEELLKWFLGNQKSIQTADEAAQEL